MKVYHGKTIRGGIRDFNQRRYGNPLFKKTTQQGRNRDFSQIKKVSVLLVVLLALAALFWYLFWSPYFQITDITINDAAPETQTAIQEILQNRLEKRRLVFFPQNSIFLYDTAAIEDEIRQQFYLDSLEIRKKLPHSLTINLRERQTTAILYITKDFFTLDSSGFLIRKLTKSERLTLQDLPEEIGTVATSELGAEAIDISEINNAASSEPTPEEIKNNSNHMPFIIEWDETNKNPQPGDEIIPSQVLNLILQAHEQLPNTTGSGLRWFSFEPTADTIEAVLKDNWKIFFSTIIPFTIQNERLALVLKEKIAERKAELEYIDLRYNERIFFRFKNALE
jgi:cell division septal protein FtsQ